MKNLTFTIKKYVKEDFDQYYSLVSNHEVMQYITGKGLSVQEAKEQFDIFLEVNEKFPEMGYYGVFNEEGQHIGDCKLEWNRPDLEVLEVGYILKKEFWGTGYGGKICKHLVGRALELYPQEDIIGIIDPSNIASKKILQNAGFETFFMGVEDNLPTEKLKFVR